MSPSLPKPAGFSTSRRDEAVAQRNTMEKRTRTWISVIIGILVVVVLLGAAAIGGTTYFVFSHIRRVPVEDAQAGDRFAEMRKRLSEQTALLEIDDRDQVVIHRSERSAVSTPGRPLRTLNAMVYDPRDGRIVDVDIPFWLLRMMPAGGRFSFLNGQGVNFDSERTRLTVEDLERHGAGLILDHRDRRGAQVLVWTE